VSKEVQAAEATQAYNHIMGTIWQPTFFAKLASAGCVPRDAAEAEKLLNMGATLYEARQHEVSKQAEAGGGLIDYAYARLGQLLDSSQTGMDMAVKQATARYRADAATLAAAVTLSRVLDAR
jgi:hypothetical protein